MCRSENYFRDCQQKWILKNCAKKWALTISRNFKMLTRDEVSNFFHNSFYSSLSLADSVKITKFYSHDFLTKIPSNQLLTVMYLLENESISRSIFQVSEWLSKFNAFNFVQKFREIDDFIPSTVWKSTPKHYHNFLKKNRKFSVKLKQTCL